MITINRTIELEVEIEGSPIPFQRGCHTLSNGDPGYPDEGGYAEDIRIILTRKDKDGKTITLDITDFVDDQLGLDTFSDDLCEAAADDSSPDEY
jgi:hypothetical protein